jgi:FkbM family methyltransferase
VSVYITQCCLSNGLLIYSNARTPLHSLFIDVFEHAEYVHPGIPPIKSGDIVVDIGANIGMFSLFAASLSPDVQVYALEPASDTFALLQKNVAANHFTNVQCERCAVAAMTGELRLYLDSGSLGDSVIREWVGNENVTGTERVPCISLDDLFSRYRLPRCDFLKVDCEGSEFNLFTTASSQTLEKIAAIAVEYHEHNGRKSCERVDLLEAHRFQVAEKRTCKEIGMLYARRIA